VSDREKKTRLLVGTSVLREEGKKELGAARRRAEKKEERRGSGFNRRLDVRRKEKKKEPAALRVSISKIREREGGEERGNHIPSSDYLALLAQTRMKGKKEENRCPDNPSSLDLTMLRTALGREKKSRKERGFHRSLLVPA